MKTDNVKVGVKFNKVPFETDKIDALKQWMKQPYALDPTDRRTGRTTRLADEYVQRLFKDRHVIVVDHWHEGKNGNHNEDRRLLDIICRRLKMEHHGLEFKADLKSCTITLKY